MPPALLVAKAGTASKVGACAGRLSGCKPDAQCWWQNAGPDRTEQAVEYVGILKVQPVGGKGKTCQQDEGLRCQWYISLSEATRVHQA